jgi:hypothetical protein
VGASLLLGFAALLAQAGPRLEIEGSETPSVATQATLTNRLASLADRTTLGGYGEHEFIAGEDELSRFRNHRYVLFVHSDISQRISTSAEVEFEWAGSPLKRDGVLGPGEVLLEFAVVDFRFTEWLQLRAGVILMPMGNLNLRHDAPSWDLSERPIAYTTVVPSTWFESGAGFFGGIPIGEAARLSYEIYTVNGLDARIYDGLGYRGARGSHIEDNNQDKAVISRVALSPWLGTEVGVSAYSGAYDLRGSRTNILNLDALVRLGDLELLGEVVRATNDPGFVEGFSSTSIANTRDAVPEDLWGFYVQANYHFRIAPLWALFPDDLKNAVSTAVVRYEGMDTDMARRSAAGDQRRLTFGLNFRPVEAFVIKNDLQLTSTGEDETKKAGEVWRPRFWNHNSLRYVTAIAFLF